MYRFFLLIIAGSLAAASSASAACGWLGTQLQCDVGSSRVVIGTQLTGEPTPAASFPIHSFRAGNGPRESVASRRPFEIELQNFGDGSLCRKIGNETYCY